MEFLKLVRTSDGVGVVMKKTGTTTYSRYCTVGQCPL